MEKCKVAYIIPVHNVNNYLNECLSSVERLKTKKEVIIVDDRGTEDPYPIIEPFLNRNHDFKYVKNEMNLGLGFARNEGMKVVSNDTTHVFFIDSDDFIDSQKTDDFVRGKLEKNKTFIMNSFYYHLKNKDIKWSSDGWFPKVYFDGGKIRKTTIYAWSSFWDARIACSTQFQTRTYEDGGWIATILKKTTDVFPIDETLYYYRRRKSSIINSKKSCDTLNDMSFMISEKARFKNFVNLDKVITGQLIQFYENYFYLSKKDRKKIIIPLVDIKFNLKAIKIAVFFQKLFLFKYWFILPFKQKNYFK